MDDASRVDWRAGLRRAHLRVARPTDRLERVVAFYAEGLGFEILSRFVDHAGFDGVTLGHEGAGYHLEFTHRRGHEAEGAPSEEHLLVFYLPDQAAVDAACAELSDFGARRVSAPNPYWERWAVTFADPDGYRVVLFPGVYPARPA